MISIDQKTSYELALEVAKRVKAQRKGLEMTQEELARKAGVSLASYKRFEQKGLASFQLVAAVAIALGCDSDFDRLFEKRTYGSIDEVIAEVHEGRRR